MLTSERKALILQVLRQEGRLIAKEFSQKLGLSEDTIRRDLRELAGEGLLQRVHGGALPASSAVADYGSRERVGATVKAKLGQAAARMIQDGQIVFVDGGTTNVQLVRHLRYDLRAVIVTHSPSIAIELTRYPFVDVELIGGRLFKHSIVTYGTTSTEAILRTRTDLFFMGATGLHMETGATTGDREEAATKRLIARQSAETIVLATSEKLGAASAHQIMPLTEIATIVTEAGLPPETLQPFSSAGVTIIEV